MMRRALLFSIAVIFSSLSRSALAGSKEADKITSLPGQPPDVKLQQYSGYIDINQTSRKSLFYYFVEAPIDAAKKPLVLWLSGGPGCSSVGVGAFELIGPLRVDTDGKSLCPNKYTWTSEANVIFPDSPVGVGFSYAANTEVYNTMGDNMTTHDSYAFLIKWLYRFPEYKGREFFIVGGSYAGHFVPELAAAILANNKLPDATPINLQGIAMGNAILEFAPERTMLYEYLWQHTFISDSAHANITKSCTNPDEPSPECQAARDSAYAQIGDVDVYNIYAAKCHDDKVRPTASKCMDLADPCGDNFVKAYMNQPEVQKAIRANSTGLKQPWTSCGPTYNLNKFGDSPKSMLPYIKALASSGTRVWLYSGDLDAMVPVTATKQDVNKLGFSVTADWRPWSSDGTDVAGYVIEYKGLVFATIRGSGHLVPIDQPLRAQVLISSFLRGQKLPQAPPQTE